MMDSFLSNKSDPQEPIEVNDLKRDLSSDFNKLQQSSTGEREHLKVYLRVRPFTSAESSRETQECVTIEHPDAVLLKPPGVSVPSRVSTEKSQPQTGQRFQFSQVYGPETTQTTLFQGTVKDLVKDVLEGGNSLVFTYGVTNAGKTFTFLGPDADAGILPRSLHMIFSSIDGRVFPAASVKPHRCQEFSRLSRVQQAEDATFKRNLFRQLKENDKTNVSLLNCTYKSDLEGSEPEPIEDRIVLHVDPNTTFSVWVSFYEIYNENIHDLLEAVPGGALRRTGLRLSQDIKGNAYVKDLRWVQVNSAQEAYVVMKLGKKNQSFSSTRLNQLSSRSHSIFSIRILRIEDVAGTPRVHAVSELCLCDLAGSERCAKTQNKGDRLKEAGNINTSLLILGKVINALRHNQQTKLLQHVPFRESKLTHYLQSFFCGRGAAACMIVNINQCASMYDETLNVLKFSALAQKVVVLSSRAPPIVPQRSSSDVSFTINNAEKKTRRSSSLIGWESSLEDVQEDDDDDDECDEGSLINKGSNEEVDDNEDDKILVCKKTHERQVALLRQLQMQLKGERAENLLMEARIREEVSREFTELFSEMRTDFDERLVREREILEERAERRLEIFKNLVNQISAAGPSQDAHAMEGFLDSFSSQFVEVEKLSVAGGRPAAGDDEESRNVLSQLQEKSSQCLQLEKKVETLELNSERMTQQLQEALTALEGEKRSREETLAALDYQTSGKEEALSAQKEERRAREELELRVEQLKQREAELQVELKEERGRRREEVQSNLKVDREEELRERMNAVQQQVVTATQTVDHLTEQLVTAQEQLDQRWEEIQEKSSEILKLQRELEELKQQVGGDGEELKQQVEELKQELHAAKITSVCAGDELRRELCQERERRHGMERQVQQLEGEKEELKVVEELRERLRQREEESTDLLKEKLQEQEVVITSLQKNLEQRQQEEHQRSTAVAHEAIAQKDDELQRRAEEISSLKQSVQQQTQKAEKLSVDLQRREDDLSDLREKLSDYKKQMEQVQKEISAMREEEKCLKQKLSDGEKNRKQLQSELAIRDRSIQQLRATPSGISEELHQKTCRELEVKSRVMEEMRLALTEQEETQQQMETMLEEKLSLIHQLHHELEQVKAKLLQNDAGLTTASQSEGASDDITALKQEAARTEETLKTLTDKHQAERRKWQEEKLSLIGQAKEAEDKRNQEMRKFAEDRERSVRQQGELESQLRERDQSMDQWRKERDTLVAALEVQLQKFLSSQAEKDALITQLRCNVAQMPPEVSPTAAQMQVALTEKETQISQLKTELEASRAKLEETKDDSSGGRGLRASVSSQCSASGSAVLDSFEISTESGRCSRFPKPELEIAFSSLQPNRMALRRQGEKSAVTVKITRSSRKRKSSEMEKDDVDAENRKNTGTKMTPHQDESRSPTTRLTSQSCRKDGALQKIGDFLHSSPTLLGSKAKKMMSLVGSPSSSSSCSSSSLSLRTKKNKRKLYRPEISSPMEVSPLNMIREPEEKESDHQNMMRRLRSRMGK
ncbi:kinesin-like protein KIF20B [Gouania willdenowi]|uniref:kinesin-like protein KIF20B n=1 Tax=Gouania willdenowi TaxID=441366 RepID=UPI0010558B8F|nr:kinesin-like protein KIF20B [Gouania willdenowi]